MYFHHATPLATVQFENRGVAEPTVHIGTALTLPHVLIVSALVCSEQLYEQTVSSSNHWYKVYMRNRRFSLLRGCSSGMCTLVLWTSHR